MIFQAANWQYWDRGRERRDRRKPLHQTAWFAGNTDMRCELCRRNAWRMKCGRWVGFRKFVCAIALQQMEVWCWRCFELMTVRLPGFGLVEEAFPSCVSVPWNRSSSPWWHKGAGSWWLVLSEIKSSQFRLYRRVWWMSAFGVWIGERTLKNIDA